ncbi:hypothetical protein, partial [Rhodococcus sp. IEGM 1408]|uniref:hypothetical protein n=1 Tax=Rhodococcus sp. IEGM 1408 TaxID=3082220 RepID=UPI00295376B1
RHERRQLEREQDAASKRADELAEKIDPDFRAASDERVAAAWESYLRTVEDELEATKTHNAAVTALAAEVGSAGAPVVSSMDKPYPQGDRVIYGHANYQNRTPTWNGTEYRRHGVVAEKLPHVADKSARRRSLDQLRGSVY